MSKLSVNREKHTVRCEPDDTMRPDDIIGPASLLLQLEHVIFLRIVEVLSLIIVASHTLVHGYLNRTKMNSIVLF